MTNHLFKRLLPIVLVAFAAVPVSAQVRLHLGIGPVEVHVAPDDPPPVIYEERYAQPSYEHVWIGGYWDREGDRWAWRQGRWERPSRRGSRWIEPVYRHDRGFTRYEGGHWSHQRVREGNEYHRWNQEHGGPGNGRGHGRHGG